MKAIKIGQVRTSKDSCGNPMWIRIGKKSKRGFWKCSGKDSIGNFSDDFATWELNRMEVKETTKPEVSR